MKKPKKNSAAQPLSRRRTPAKSGAKISKADAAETPKKTVKPRKQIAKTSQETAPEQVKSQAEPTAEVKPKVKKKPAAAAKPVETKLEPTPPAKPDVESKPVAKTKKSAASKITAEPAAKVKASSEAAPVLKAKTVATAKSAKTEPKAKVKIHAQPVAKAKSLAPAKAAPATESPTEAEPAEEASPVVEVEFVVEVAKPPAKPNGNKKSMASAEPDGEPKPPAPSSPAPETKPPVAKPASPVASAKSKPPTRPARKAPAKIPPILLEGDKPAVAPVSGPGHRYALGPKPPVEKLQTEGELPESYGTGEILLAARDPHWLYTHWDLRADQQRRYNGFSRDGHLIVRIYVDQPGGKPVAQVHVHPESRHWFVHVDRANTRYVAELGYYSAADKWTVVATSAATLTPPDAVATETAAEFGTIPFEVPMEKLLSLVKEAVQENAPLAQALQELRAEGHAELPRIDVPPPTAESEPARSAAPAKTAAAKPPRARWTPSAWTPAQERALAEVISMDHVRRVWMGSLEITELIRRQFINELASMSAAEISAPTSPSEAVTGITSPGAGPAQPPKGFWFNVNAELIVYGATEKDATVSIGGRKIKLRPDGSFSYRFALPDGNYEMPVVAVSADQTDGRAAEMKFSRSTEYRGHVGAHPQDPSLRQLLLENF